MQRVLHYLVASDSRRDRRGRPTQVHRAAAGARILGLQGRSFPAPPLCPTALFPTNSTQPLKPCFCQPSHPDAMTQELWGRLPGGRKPLVSTAAVLTFKIVESHLNLKRVAAE